MAVTLYVEDIVEGLERSFTKTVTEADVQAFGEVSGDFNPVHFDEAYAATTMFGGRIAHGMMTASLISAVIGEQLPGAGAIYLSQSLRFRAPVRVGDTVVAKCKVQAVDVVKRRLTLICTCHVGDKLVLDGEALVLAPSRAMLVAAE